MAADRARADEEDLKVSPFQKGEWEQTRPTELDVDYALLAEALGPAAGGAEEGIRETRKTAMERTLCEGTHVNVDSAWRLWLIFCPIRGIDAATFGQLADA